MINEFFGLGSLRCELVDLKVHVSWTGLQVRFIPIWNFLYNTVFVTL
jgi:hypothetical protein